MVHKELSCPSPAPQSRRSPLRRRPPTGVATATGTGMHHRPLGPSLLTAPSVRQQPRQAACSAIPQVGASALTSSARLFAPTHCACARSTPTQASPGSAASPPPPPADRPPAGGSPPRRQPSPTQGCARRRHLPTAPDWATPRGFYGSWTQHCWRVGSHALLRGRPRRLRRRSGCGLRGRRARTRQGPQRKPGGRRRSGAAAVGAVGTGECWRRRKLWSW